MFRIHYINLDRRTDRSVQFQRELAKIRLISVESGPYYVPGSVVRFPAIERSPGWMGCRDSHIRLIQLAQRDNLDYITVFEDDTEIIVTDRKYYDELFAEAGLASPFSDQSEKTKTNELIPVKILYLCANTHEPLIKASGKKHLYHARRVRSTSAIVYTRAVYDDLLTAYTRGWIKKIDLYLEQLQQKGGCYVADRLCATQHSGMSDIEGLPVDYSFIADRFMKHVNPQGVLPH